MIQFTLGCVLIALSLFFGGSEIMSNFDIIKNRTTQLSSEKMRVESSKSVKNNFESYKKDSISYSAELKENLISQLNIDDRFYDFSFADSEDSKDKVLKSIHYTIKGYDNYAKVFSLIGDIEKLNGLFIDQTCLGCKIATKKVKRENSHISFKIEGEAYVYREK